MFQKVSRAAHAGATSCASFFREFSPLSWDRFHRSGRYATILTTVVATSVILLSGCVERDSRRVLVVTASEDFRHGSTPAGIEALRSIGDELGMVIDVADSAEALNEQNLKAYRAVVFLNTSGDILSYAQQADFERFVQAGGGFMGIHGAADTETDWEWYTQLLGARFQDPYDAYPRMRPGVITRSASYAPAPADSLPLNWSQTDEWYRLEVDTAEVEVLLFLNEDDGADGRRPVSWRHEFDGGHVFYTMIGHNPHAFDDAAVRAHLKDGLSIVAGGREGLDYTRASTVRMPEESRFVRTVLADSLDEPTELVLPGAGKVVFIERKGALKLYDPESERIRVIGQIEVHTEFEDGLMGAALDPNFKENHWIYLYYSPRGDEPMQHLSRFELRDDSLLLDTEVVMLEVHTQRDECCHTGGSIEFGPDGNLFLSTGDDVNPFESDGFAPIDERPGRSPFDAQGTSANANDLRGKILRITPQADGSYTIPEGNLFPPGTAGARPEIYVMGNRNPYRISIDPRTGFLYWGEVGPDAGEDDPERGPRGHDEVNQARSAGFFGWPYFVGDNKAYHAYNFSTETPGPAYDPQSPVNDSPNNTGLRNLPPAQPAFIWYPYAVSPEFPITGTGGRNAMAGPVFYSDLFEATEHTFPAYFDGKLFIYDWMRGWVLVVTMDATGDLQRLEPFMPSVRWNNAIDMAFDERGVMYVLEYGTGWFQQNADARLNRIIYQTGNRPPVARISADSLAGADPMTAHLSAAETVDPDGDALSFVWTVDGRQVARTDDPTYVHTFENVGTFTVSVTARDAAGQESSDELAIRVGNAPPRIELEIAGNRSFYWDGRALDYTIRVVDPETGPVDTSAVTADAVYVAFNYLERGFDADMLAAGHRIEEETGAFSEGRRLIAESDCAACHSTASRSIGPSYVDVALRYRDQENAVGLLAAKIIQGGGGVWGDQAMAAHPQLSEREASAMVEYILALAEESVERESLPLSGRLTTGEHMADTTTGTYVMRVHVTDEGAGGAAPATGEAMLLLRHPRVEAESYDVARGVDVEPGRRNRSGLLKNIYDGSYAMFADLDLTDMRALTYGIVSHPLHSSGGRIEVRLDREDGRLIGESEVRIDSTTFGPMEISGFIEPVREPRNVYFVFRNDQGVTPEALFLLDWIEFGPDSTTTAAR